MKDSKVANKLDMFMWSTGNDDKERLTDKLSTMEQRPHENPVLAAKGHMQYKWFRSNLRDQEVVKKNQIQLNAHIHWRMDLDLMHWLGQLWNQGADNGQPNKMAM